MWGVDSQEPVTQGPPRASRSFDGPVGALDARVHGEASLAPVLLLHPHPVFGGTMGTRFVYRLAQAIAEAGHQAIRFDFRGVGRSEGQYGHGEGEVEDAVAVWDALKQESGQAPWVIGFSFGAGVAARLATLRPVPGVILVSVPARVRESTLAPIEDAPHIACPAHVIIGTKDAQVPPADAVAVHGAIPNAGLTELDGADHFLTPTHHDRAVGAVLEALRALQGL